MEDFKEMDNVVEVTDLDTGITELVPVETDENEVSDSEGVIGAGDIAIGTLCLVGAGFLIKKAVDGGKWVVGKIKGAIAAKKNQDPDIDDEPEADLEDAEEQPEEPDQDATEDVPEEKTPKGKRGKK